MFKRKCGPSGRCFDCGGSNSSASEECSISRGSADSWPSDKHKKSNVTVNPSSVMDKEMVKELNQLSIHDRQKVYEDIHGVAEGIEETPELVSRSIRQLFECVEKIRKRSAYEKAVFLSPSYVKNPEFCLQFLRTEDFHARNAAKRMVAYYEMKYELFGLDALVRDLTIEEDIDEDVMSLLKRGVSQILPSLDSAGRLVVAIFFRQATNDYTPIQISKMATYMFEKSCRVHARPEKGVVMIMYDAVDSGSHPPFTLDRLHEATRFFAAAPLNIKAWHVCYKDVSSTPTMELFKMAMGTSGRIRVRSCFGTDTECRYHLMTFGIPTSEIPVSHSGSLDLDPHHLFLQKQRQSEQPEVHSRKLQPPPYPTSMDVVCGKGQPFQQHAGNLRMRAIVDRHFPLYVSLSRKQSQQLFQKVTAEMMQSGTRFLRKNSADDGWVAVDEKEAHKKVAGVFRNKALSLAKSGGVARQ